ncbi:hypothetical protein HK097_002314 [Rhizophlyctis rosea]|uniref:Uncharacterized protein n=1 Tax=Rhizophlyctis rosea TaxID=64517 RepID=A0AAD5SLD0_9FUNG|nr:hypothetical protein HK097_002314 [Rhizophlyctis rosea]
MPREDPSVLLSPSAFTSPDFPSDFDPDSDVYPPPRHDPHHPHHIRFAKAESFDTSATSINVDDQPDADYIAPPQDREFPRRQSVSVSLEHVLSGIPPPFKEKDESALVGDAGLRGVDTALPDTEAGLEIPEQSAKSGSMGNLYGRRVSIVAPDPARAAPISAPAAEDDDLEIIVAEGNRSNEPSAPISPKKRRMSLDPSRFQPLPGSETGREDTDASAIELDNTPPPAQQQNPSFSIPSITGQNPPSSSSDLQTYRDGIDQIAHSEDVPPPNSSSASSTSKIKAFTQSSAGVDKYDLDDPIDPEEEEPAYAEEDEDDWEVGVGRKEHSGEFQDEAGLDFGDVDMSRTDDDEGMDPMENA